MKFLCLACDIWNMDWIDAQVHKIDYPDHTIKDTLGRIRLEGAEDKAAMKLLDLLDDFQAAMLQKFIDRHDRVVRRWGRSVVDDDFDWDNLNLEHIEEHFREEIAEWLQAEPWNRAGEDVDIANMAFLDWVGRRLGAEDNERL